MAADGAEVILGVRTNSSAVYETLRSRLSTHLIDGFEPSPNISVRVGERVRGKREASLVYRRNRRTFQSLDTDLAVEAAMQTLHTMLPPPAGTTMIRARAYLRNGRAVLATDGFGEHLDPHHRKITANGYTIVPYSPVLVDAQTAELLLHDGSDPAVQRFQRVPISHLLVYAPEPEPGTPGVVLFSHLTPFVVGRGEPTTRVELEALVDLHRKVEVVRADDADPKKIIPILAAL